MLAEASASEEAPCAQRILLALQRRAYRRPVTVADAQTLMPFYTAGRAEGGFELGIQRAIERLLVSPQFLSRIERDPPGAALQHIPSRLPISGTGDRASRSFSGAVSRTMNCWTLRRSRQTAATGSAGTAGTPHDGDDACLESLVTNFAEQWLYLKDLDAKKPNELLFPDFDESLRTAFRKETDLFLDSVLRSRSKRAGTAIGHNLHCSSTSVWQTIMAFPMCMAVTFAASHFSRTAHGADCWGKAAF